MFIDREVQLHRGQSKYGSKIMNDRIRGGLADKKKPSDFDKDQLEKGIEVEMEHTSSREIAMEIAMDHLSEDKDYYKKLGRIEE